MPLLVGIDEAGYGPLLGPLVISSASFVVPAEHVKADFWNLLKKSCSKQKKRLLGRLLICDSKKAHTKSTGIKHLQRTTLACLKIYSQNHQQTLHQLLKTLAPECLSRLDNYPWHKDPHQIQLNVNHDDIAIAANAFEKELLSNQINLYKTSTCCLDVAHYNQLIDSVKNKAAVLFSETAQLIKQAYDTSPDNNIQIIVDRQGGRTHYRKKLQTIFPNLDMAILKESQATSSYELSSKTKTMKIHFTVKADDRFLPVSLASMQSKYIRELLVANINRYFLSFHPNLKPTAGYWTDGLRFIEDIKKHLPDVEYQKNQLIRSR
ncbi:MAG: hypothetical protein H8D47_02470 [Planctomycetes bacterium]|nr:hypothetical protein [Planctomycetota bacterium]